MCSESECPGVSSGRERRGSEAQGDKAEASCFGGGKTLAEASNKMVLGFVKMVLSVQEGMVWNCEEGGERLF